MLEKKKLDKTWSAVLTYCFSLLNFIYKKTTDKKTMKKLKKIKHLKNI